MVKNREKGVAEYKKEKMIKKKPEVAENKGKSEEVVESKR